MSTPFGCITCFAASLYTLRGCSSNFNELWDYLGQGYATEAVTALKQFAFDSYHAMRVEIRTQRENTRSIAIAKRCGFVLEAVLKNYFTDLH